MVNTTYIRASASCLPVAGPILGWLNCRKVEEEFSYISDSLRDSFYKYKSHIMNLNLQTPENKAKIAAIAAVIADANIITDIDKDKIAAGIAECINMAKITAIADIIPGDNPTPSTKKTSWSFPKKIQITPELKKQYLSFEQNRRLYAICNTVGTVLTIAVVVGLIALAIFTGVSPAAAGLSTVCSISMIFAIFACMSYYNLSKHECERILLEYVYSLNDVDAVPIASTSVVPMASKVSDLVAAR